GATMRRNYRDWAATNLKQPAGFLTRQYLEAADLVVERVTSHPADQPIFITGHSKGGGAAAYAAAAACLAEGVSPDRARRLRVVTFNAAVVQPSNWQRLYRRHRLANREAENRIAGVLTITAVTLRDDPVSKIRGAERPAFEQVVQLQPVPDSLSSLEQHGIEAVIAALTAVGFGSLDR
ncbi:MAG: hypothetical protein LIP77_02500, partial [Planctomycetes bacterium]|nr:hypothetical protein [Planctomycetota bacterium]